MANGEPISSGRIAASKLDELGGDLARERAGGRDDLAVDRGDVEPAAEGVVGDRAARGELRSGREHMHETVILWSWQSLVSTPTIRGSILPALMSATPTSSNTTFLFLSSASPSGSGLPPRALGPNWSGSIGRGAATGPPARARPRTAPRGRRARRARPGPRRALRAARRPPRAGAGSGRGTARRGARRRRSTRRTGSGRRRMAARDALGLDRLGLVEEPVDLLRGVVGEARVLALSQMRVAHLEVAERVGVAEVDVVRLDSTSAAMTGSWAGMPRFSASAAIHAAICSFGASSPGYSPARPARSDRRPAPRRPPARRQPAGAPRRRGLGVLDGLQEQVRVDALRGLGARAAATRAARRRRRTGRTRAPGPPPARRRAGRARGRRRPAPAAAPAAPAARRPRARRRRRRRLGAGGELGGELEVGGELGLEADVDVVLVGGVGEVAGAVDGERRADLVGADRGSSSRARRRSRGRAGWRGRRSRRRSRRCRARGRRRGWRSSRRR